MGRLPIALTLLGTILIGGAALAQQGLVVDPWRRSAPPAPAAPAAALPKLGLPVGAVAPPVALAPKAAAAAEQPVPTKWSPPVVELLVDPWAKQQLARPARPRWVPENVEIIDPWPESVSAPPRVASLPAKPSIAPIF